MRCVHCGAEVRLLDKFCRKCGEKQSEATPVPSVSAESQAPTPSVSAESQAPTPSVSAESQAPTQPQDIPATRELFRSNETPPASRPYVVPLAVGVVVLSAILFVVAEDWYRSEREAAIVSEGATTTTSEALVSEGATTTTSEALVSEGATTTTSEALVSEGATTTTSEALVSEGATTTTSEALVSEGATTTTSEALVSEGATTTTSDETFVDVYLEWAGSTTTMSDGILDILLEVAGGTTCSVFEAAGGARFLQAIGCFPRWGDGEWGGDTWKIGLFTVFVLFFFLFGGGGFFFFSEGD